MLTRRAKGQKPCPALSFHNGEQGFLALQITTKTLKERAVFHPPAVPGGAAAPASLGVAR